MSQRPVYRRLVDLALGGRRGADAEMDQEIESHLAMRIADLVRTGMSADDARAEAIRRFGDFDDARRRLRTAARQREAAVRHRDWTGALVADFRYALRQARRAPGFTAIAAATLAIGIGATTTIFTLVDHVLLRPLPFPHAERLVSLFGLDSAHNTIPTVSSADWSDWQRARGTETALYGFAYRQNVVTSDSAIRVSAEQVSPNYFSVLQARFIVGRPFAADAVQSGAAMVVISERVWRGLFGADPTLATPLRTATAAYTIAGVVARGQEFPMGTDLWIPVAARLSADPSRININWHAIGRLAPGTTTGQATAELSAIARGIHARDPTALYDYGVSAAPLGDTVVGDASTYLKLLMAVVGFVLLIVCANVAAAGLARGSARSREMAVRTSLGAMRSRLV
jgi:putative ABC transport system permease protein